MRDRVGQAQFKLVSRDRNNMGRTGYRVETRAGATCEIEWASTVPRQMRDISAPVKIIRLGEGQGGT